MTTPQITPDTQFLSELLWTDTIVWEIVKRTVKTITVRSTMTGEVLSRENRDGNPYPCVFSEALSDPEGIVHVLRLRQDGTYRMGASGKPMRPAQMIDGKPVRFADYRQ